MIVTTQWPKSAEILVDGTWRRYRLKGFMYPDGYEEVEGIFVTDRRTGDSPCLKVEVTKLDGERVVYCGLPSAITMMSGDEWNDIRDVSDKINNRPQAMKGD
jgi:hypothetical protein